METTPAYTFTRIPDVEVNPTKIDYSINCVGCNKTHSDMMLTITHAHSTDEGYNGKAFIFLDRYQIVNLIATLNRGLALLPEGKHGKALSLDQYKSMLSAHDWFYDYSDDNRVWKAGRAAHDELIALSKTSPEFLALYNAKHDEMFKREIMSDDEVNKDQDPNYYHEP